MRVTQINLVDADIVDIDAVTTIGIADPHVAFQESSASPRPAVAAQTAGPHRYSIVVPHNDESVINVGTACPTRINDTGITGRTKSHIHWHTRGGSPETMVALGGEPTRVLTVTTVTISPTTRGI